MGCSATNGGNLCFSNSNPACTNYFGTCNSAGTNDGICVEVVVTGQPTFSSCWQSNLNGGGPGTLCDPNATRQDLSGFCDTSDFCTGGLCQPVCDTTGASHTCSGSTTCTETNVYGNASNLGTCEVACDFTTDAGTTCVTSDAGVGSRCLPQLFVGLPGDTGQGVCVAAPPTPIQPGQPCSGVPGLDTHYPDPCAPGSGCIGSPLNGYVCTPLCNNPGLNCADGVTPCNSLNGLANTGFCQ
jgi:hypothetical protein